MPAPMNITFFHFYILANVDFLNYAFMLLGFLMKCLEINPFSTILAIIATFFCTFQDDAIVNNLGPIESDSSIKSSNVILT